MELSYPEEIVYNLWLSVKFSDFRLSLMNNFQN